ncbi:hypothetical protein FI667_g2567, partial [Globisporangium splendens]
MNNTNQQLYAIYKNIQSFYNYRKLVSIDEELSQDQCIKRIQKDKCVLLSAVDRHAVANDAHEVDSGKLNSAKKKLSDASQDLTPTCILLIYPGTECENKRGNMTKLINRIRYPRARILVITPTRISPGVMKGLQALSSLHDHRHHEIKAFTYMLLNSVLPEFELAPKYEILTVAKLQHLRDWFVDPDTLPKIFEHDPQMVCIGAMVGDVVKFTFMSEVTIEGIGYCRVISNP